MRFKNMAWRMIQLMPSNLKWIKDSKHKVKIWHMSAGLSFQNYNCLLKSGQLVECSDGHIRDCVFVLAGWLGDQPEIDCLCCSIQVCTLCMNLRYIVYSCVLKHRVIVTCVTYPRHFWTIFQTAITAKQNRQFKSNCLIL